jgi:hypothetical protein
MMIGLYIIVTTVAMLLLSIRLHEAHEEIARIRGECDQHAQETRNEYAAYAHGVMMLAFVLVRLAAASRDRGARK